MGLKTVGSDLRTATREVLQSARDPRLFVWALYLLTVPIYVIKSGLPQPGDWLIVVLAPLAWTGRRRLGNSSALVVRALVALTAYMIFVNVAWSAALGNWAFSPRDGFLMSPLFYIYNTIMFAMTMLLYERYRSRMLWFTGKIVLASLVLQVVISAVIVSPSLRVTVLFNNANQLGFYALLSASLLFALQRRKYVTSMEVTVGMIAAVYLCLLSASKAALGGISMLAVFGLVVRVRTMLLVGTIVVLSLAADTPIRDAIERTMSRFETDQSHGTFEERGYDRIANHPEYLIIGSGEGDYQRFKETTVIGSHEIHSSIGTLAFCYGLVGVMLFGVFVWFALRGSGLSTWLLVAPSFAYGMAHQGLRFTLFWVMLAIVAAIRSERQAALARAKWPITSATLSVARPRA